MTFFQTVREKKVIIVGGKGGVGKTTVAASLALRLSQEKKCLVVSTDPAHSLSDSFSLTIGDSIMQVYPDLTLFALEISAEKAYAAFLTTYRSQLKLLFDTSTYLDEGDINEMLEVTIPGLDEVMSLKIISDKISEGEFDTIVIDTAPTGHALRLMSMPEVMDSWIKMSAKMRWKYREVIQTFKGAYTPDQGDDFLVEMKKAVKRIHALLRNHHDTLFVPVMIPTKMSLSETERLIDRLSETGIAAHHLLINQVSLHEDTSRFYRQKHDAESLILEQAKRRFSALDVLILPLSATEITGREGLAHFAHHFDL